MTGSINQLAERAYKCALRRRKIEEEALSHNDTVSSLGEEFLELILAHENAPSEHIREYTQAEEELTDILITCMTELYRRGVDVEKIISKKMDYNEKR